MNDYTAATDSDNPSDDSPRPFRWNPKKEQAAAMRARGDSWEGIARELDLNQVSLWRWRKHSEFMARVEFETARIRDAVIAKGIADRQNRIDAGNRRHQLLEQVIRERGTDPLLKDVPGGSTGLLVATPTIIKVYQESPVTLGDPRDDEVEVIADREYLDSVRRSSIEYEYSLDTGLLKEMRELEKQIAQEMGQWAEKREVTGADGAPLQSAQVHVYLPHNGRDPRKGDA